MGLTKSQVSNFLNDKILFRFSISSDYIINFSEHEEIYTFEELEKIIKRNYSYWDSTYESSPNNFRSVWKDLNDKFNTIKNYIFEFTELDIDDINNKIYYNLSSNRETREQDKIIYILSVQSPIDKDKNFIKIKNFVSFYIEQSQSELDNAVKSFIYLYKNNIDIGSYFSSTNHFMFYPALYLLRKNFSNIKDNVNDFETNIVAPLASKLKDISDESDEQYRQITALIEDKHY